MFNSKEYNKKYYLLNKNKILKQCSKYKKNNSKKVKECLKRWYVKNGKNYYKINSKRIKELHKIRVKNNPKKFEIKYKNDSWRKLGIKTANNLIFSIKDYNKLYKIQKGKCAICKKHSKKFKRALAADHNHTTNIVRGLLCIKCNSVLGFYENKIFNNQAIKYLGKYAN